MEELNDDDTLSFGQELKQILVDMCIVDNRIIDLVEIVEARVRVLEQRVSELEVIAKEWV